MSAPMSAVEVLSGPVLLTLSFVGHDPKRKSPHQKCGLSIGYSTLGTRYTEIGMPDLPFLFVIHEE